MSTPQTDQSTKVVNVGFYDLLWNPYYDREYGLNMMPDNDYGGEVEICRRVKKLRPDALEWEDDE